MLSPAQYVIQKFGGLTGTARAIGVPVTTVQGWQERGRIPQDHWKRLMSAAAANDKLITFDDFLTDHAEPPSAKADAA
jgi:hypothetical protein